jgi:hypothetical protein
MEMLVPTLQNYFISIMSLDAKFFDGFRGMEEAKKHYFFNSFSRLKSLI